MKKRNEPDIKFINNNELSALLKSEGLDSEQIYQKPIYDMNMYFY